MDIRFWILFFAIIRIYGITNPPAEVVHSWRQTTVAMVARNFYEVDSNIFYPRIDISEDLTGITGMEFPLLNYLVYLMSLLFGYEHWYGRLINLLVTSLGCYYFYRLLKKYFSERTAFCSTLILTASLWFVYARKVMPDTFSMSLVIMGLYYGTNYLEGNAKGWKDLILYALFSLFGILSKLPSGYIMVLFLLPMLNREVKLRRKAVFAGVSVLICVPVAWWYFYWVPYLVEEYGLWHFFMGKGFGDGFREIMANMGDTLAHFYDDALKFIGFGVFVVGLVFCVLKKEKLALWVTSISFVAFCGVIFKSGWTFAHHAYYVVPFVPVMALVAGYGVASIQKKWLQVLLLVAISIENIGNRHTDFIIREDRQALLRLEEEFDQFSQPTDLIVANSGEDPTAVYFAHRKGWVASNEQLSDVAYLEDLRSRGCKYVLVLKKVFGSEMVLNCERIVDTEDYSIYCL